MSAAVGRVREVGGLHVPTFVYGTAWKEEGTRDLVELAISRGFRAIDTANQRRHYHEAGVGEAIAAVVGKGLVTRDDLFLQTKFTFRPGQDHRLPYDPRAPVAEQVAQSFQSSLEHLGTERLDSYVLHGPSRRYGLGPEDREAWGAMEALALAGRTRLLGVSNVGADQLEELCAGARVPPAFVQNRCFARFGWDREVRAICARRGIAYQGFSLLTANPEVLGSPAARRIAGRLGCPVTLVVFRFALEVGMIPLTGTTDPEHMTSDLGVYDVALDEGERDALERISG